MTENQWPPDGSYATPPAAQQTAARNDPAFASAPQGTQSKTDAARNEAGEVTRQASDAAQNVAETAKAEAANVAAEVKANAKDLLYQAKTDLTDQAGTQQQKVAQGLRSIASELQSMAAASDQPGVATDLVRQAAERSSSVASWLDGRDPGSLLDEVKSFARQRPGAFLLLAAGAGILAGRLGRSLSAGAPASGAALPGMRAPITRTPGAGTAVPPPPVQLPGPDSTTAGLAGTREPLGDDQALAGRPAADTYPSNPLTGERMQEDRWTDDPLAADRVPESPLSEERVEKDPYRDDPLSGGRR